RNFGLSQNERGARHTLNPACNHQRCFTRLNSTGGDCDGFEARAAETIDCRPRHLHWEPSQQKRHTRHVAIVLAGLIRASVDDIIDRTPIDSRVSLYEGLDGNCREIIGAQGRQNSPITPERRANGVTNVGVACAHFGCNLRKFTLALVEQVPCFSIFHSLPAHHLQCPSDAPCRVGLSTNAALPISILYCSCPAGVGAVRPPALS